MHGGLSIDARRPRGRSASARANTTRGQRTAEMERMRKAVRGLIADAKRLVELT
jgi:hypothetical protein